MTCSMMSLRIWSCLDVGGVLGRDDDRLDAHRLAVAYRTVTWLLPSGRR